MTTNKELWFLA